MRLRAPALWGERLARLYWDEHGVESVCVRIGSAIARPTEFRHLSTWFGLDDLMQFVMGCVWRRSSRSS